MLKNREYKNFDSFNIHRYQSRKLRLNLNIQIKTINLDFMITLFRTFNVKVEEVYN